MLNSLIDSLRSHRRLAVFSHIRPDGDALGSQIGFCHWLRQIGVEAVAYNDDDAPYNLAWLTEFFPIHKPAQDALSEVDGIVLLDGNHPDRFGKMSQAIAESPLPKYLIDHHPSPPDIYKDRLWDVKASSTAELIFRLYQTWGLDAISTEAAQALYTGIVTDTGSFRFDSVSPATHRAAALLLEKGDFKPDVVHIKLYDQRTPAQYALLSASLATMRFFADGRIGIITATQAMFRETGTSYQDTDSLVAYPMSVKGVEAAVIFVEHQDRIKLSFRSKTDLDVNQWARHFEGGGHAKAAGGWTDGPLEAAVARVLHVGLAALSHPTS